MRVHVRVHRSATQPLSVIYGPHLDNGPWILCVWATSAPWIMLECVGTRGEGQWVIQLPGSIWIAKTTILTFTDHNNLNLNLNLPFRKWDHFGRGYAMPQGINLDMCRLCPRDCYFTSKHFKWQRERQTMRKKRREDWGKKLRSLQIPTAAQGALH